MFDIEGGELLLNEKMLFEESEWVPAKALKISGEEEMVKHSRLSWAKSSAAATGMFGGMDQEL